MLEPAQLGLNFGKAPKRKRTPKPEPAPDPLAGYLILHGPTLLDAAGEVELWARFTRRTTED